MSYIQTIKDLENHKIFPVYLLYGNEPFLLQNAQQKIVNAVLDKPEYDLTYSVVDLENIPVQNAVHDAETFPFFGEKKVLVLKNASFFKAVPDKSTVDHDLGILAEYLKNPVDYTVLIMVCPNEKIDARKKIVKLIQEHGQVVECQKPKEKELYQWIQVMSGELNLKLDRNVVSLLAEEVGTDLMALQKEMEKLSLFSGGDGLITMEDAEPLISHHAQATGFKMLDAIMNHELKEAIRIFKDLRKQNEEPIALLALLASQVRLILQCKLMKNKGYTQNQMAKQLQVHPFRVKMALDRETYFSLDELYHMIDRLTGTDDRIKRGEMDKDLAIELLLYEFAKTRTS